MTPQTFYLGTDRPTWFALTDVPLMFSHRTLRGRRSHHRARGPWVLDSGGFTELNLHGRWVTTPEEYADSALDYADRIGNLLWASPQDWMTEPFVTDKTGLSVAEHQRRSTASVLRLRELAPEVWWLPVIQGWHPDDYLRHVEQYATEGIDLTAEPLVGIGSVCRRQNLGSVAALITDLESSGLRLHGYGFKVQGLSMVGAHLASADSFAWSYQARRDNERLPGCLHRGRCAHCLTYALQWRDRVLSRLDAQQLSLAYGGAA